MGSRSVNSNFGRASEVIGNIVSSPRFLGVHITVMSSGFDFDDIELDEEEHRLLYGETSNPANFSPGMDIDGVDYDDDDNADDYADGVTEERWKNAASIIVEDRTYNSRSTLNEIVNLSPFVRMFRTICYVPKPTGGQIWFEVGAVRKAYVINLIAAKHFLRNANFWREICSTREANTAMILETFLSDAMQWITEQKGDPRKNGTKPVFEKHYELLFLRRDSVTGIRDYANPDGRASDIPGGIRVWVHDITPYTDNDVVGGTQPATSVQNATVILPDIAAAPAQEDSLLSSDDISIDDDDNMQLDVLPPVPVPVPATNDAKAVKKKGYDPIKKMAAGVNKVLSEGQRVRELVDKRTGNDDPTKRNGSGSHSRNTRNPMLDKLDPSLERFSCTTKEELRGKVASYFNGSLMVELDSDQHLVDILSCATSESDDARLRSMLLRFRDPREEARGQPTGITSTEAKPHSVSFTPVMLLDKESAMAYNTECICDDQCNLSNYIPTDRAEHNIASRFGEFYPSYPETLGGSPPAGHVDNADDVIDALTGLTIDNTGMSKNAPRSSRATNWRELASHMLNRFSSLCGLNIADGSLGVYPFPNAVVIGSQYVRFAEVQSQIPLPFSLGEVRGPRSAHVRYTETNLFESLHVLMTCSTQSIPEDIRIGGNMPDMTKYRSIYVSATKLIREDTYQSLNRAMHMARSYSKQMFVKNPGKSKRPLTTYQFVHQAKSDMSVILMKRVNNAEREVARRSDVNSVYSTTMNIAHQDIKTTAGMTTGNPDEVEDKHWRDHQNATNMDSNGDRKRDTAMTFKMLTRPQETLQNPFSNYADQRVSRTMDKDSDDCTLRDMDIEYHSYYLRLQKEFAAAATKQYMELSARYDLVYPDPGNRPPLESFDGYTKQKWKRLVAQVRYAAHEFECNEDTELIHKQARVGFDTTPEPNVTIRHRMDLRPHSNWMAYLISTLRWFFGAAVNYRLVILVIMSKEHGKRYYVDHTNPKTNLMIAGPRSKGKSWSLKTAARLSVTTQSVTHRTALSEAALGDNGGGAELQEEAEMALFGKEDKNGGDGNNITKNILASGRIDTRRLRKDPDTGRMVREVISSNAQKVLIVCSNQPVEKMMSDPMKDRFIMVNLPDADASVGDRAIDRTPPAFLNGDHDTSDAVRTAKHMDFVYLFVEHMFRSGALDHIDVMMDTADVVLGEIVHEIESHPGVRSIGPRKLNFIREFVRTFAIRDAIAVIFSSMYTNMYPTRENTGDMDCVYTQAQVDDFKARGVRVPFTVDVFLYLILPFMVATSDHVASAVTMMDFLWSGNQHDAVMPVFVDVILGGTGNGKMYKESTEKENRKMDIRVIKKSGGTIPANRFIHHSQPTELEYENGHRKRSVKLDPNYIVVEGGTRDQIHFRIKMLITDDPPSEENLASFFYSLCKKTFESRGVDCKLKSGEIVWGGEETRAKRVICRYSDVDGKPVLEVLVPYLLQHYNIRLSNDKESGQTPNEIAFANERSRALREMIMHRRGLELDTLCELETSDTTVLENARDYAKCHRLETIQTQAIVEVLSRETTNLIGNDVELTKSVEQIYKEERGEIPWEKMIIQRAIDPYVIRGGPDDNIQNSVHGCSANVPLHGIFKVLYVPRDPAKGMLCIHNYNTATVSAASYFFDDSSGGFNGTGSERDRAARYYGTATSVFVDRDPDLNGVQLHQRELCLPPLPYPDDVRKAVTEAGNLMFDTPAYPVHRYFIEQYFDMYDEGAELDLGGMNFEQYVVRPVITYPEHDIRKAVRDREEILAMSMTDKLKNVHMNAGLLASLERSKTNALSFDNVRRGAVVDDEDSIAKVARWKTSATIVKNRVKAIARNPAVVRLRDSNKSMTRSSQAVLNLFKRPVQPSGRQQKRKRAKSTASRMQGITRTRSPPSKGMKRQRPQPVGPSAKLRHALGQSSSSNVAVDNIFSHANANRYKRPPSHDLTEKKKKKKVWRLDTGGMD